jgi:uncharacterized protein (DUF305 family)
MEKKHLKVSTWVLLLSVVILLAACAAPLAQNQEGVTAGTPEAEIPATAGDFDELFINMMVPHHEGAVEMALIAQERSQRPEVQQMANEIIALQAGEIDQMRAWKQAWYGTSDTPSMSEMPSMREMPGMGGAGHAMDMQAEVEALRNAPEPFDLAFIDAMIEHHQSAIEAAELGLNQATRPEITAMAQAIIADQQREIDQMMAWRQAWFPDAPPLAAPTGH